MKALTLAHFLPPRLAAGLLLAVALACAADEANIPASGSALAVYQPAVTRLIDAAIASDSAKRRLAELCDRFGPRFSGSTNLELAIDWIISQMKADGLENVHGEPALVPHWVRGAESLEIIEPRAETLPLLGLGGSIGTPPEGVTASVLVVRSFAELKDRAAEAKGRIVVFNAPFTQYGETVAYRADGASEAARAGAVACLVRSVTPLALRLPHTGAMRYNPAVPKIPSAAITVEDAERFQRFQERGESITLRLKMEARTLPDSLSRNVIGEIVGREKPEEVVVVSGHIDSWDVGQGAQDDGGNSVAAWEAVRLMHRLSLRPRRTVRVILWTNEENGTRGAKAYVADHRASLTNHVMAIEADEGTFRPLGFGFAGSEPALATLRQITQLCGALGPLQVTKGAFAADAGYLQNEGVPMLDLKVEDSRYFWYHHTAADTADKVDAKDLSQCAAALAAMCYVVAEMPERLSR
ncbi:MAG TPA: M20/M25/M40 family metallo-hydrolase [Verrucomicrobiae bacterium]|nr:M20/M25/M40 family metallo-hydrolase [Verrucomicrobiae bacterium]